MHDGEEPFIYAGRAEHLNEEKEVSYYGFILQDGGYLGIANMTTGTYYGFTKE